MTALLATPSEMPGFWKGLQELVKPEGRWIGIFPLKASQFFLASLRQEYSFEQPPA